MFCSGEIPVEVSIIFRGKQCVLIVSLSLSLSLSHFSFNSFSFLTLKVIHVHRKIAKHREPLKRKIK